jgi:phage terminase small subunit
MSELHDTYVKGFAEEGEQLASLIKEHIEARDAENAQYDDILPQRVQEEVFDRSVKVLQSAGYRVVKPDGTVLDKK